MKLINYLLLALPTLLFACQSTSPDGNPKVAESPDIQIHIDQGPIGWAYLVGIYGDQRFKLDSAQMDEKGDLHFQREEPYPQGVVYVLLANSASFPLIVDVDQTMKVNTVINELIGQIKVEGNLENELLYGITHQEDVYNRQIEPLNSQVEAMDPSDPAYPALAARRDSLVRARTEVTDNVLAKYPDAFVTKFKNAGKNPDIPDVMGPDGQPDLNVKLVRYRRAFWDGVDFSDERLLRTPVIYNKLNRYMTELTIQDADSIIQSADALINRVKEDKPYFKFFVNWIGLKYEPGKVNLMDAEAVYVHLVQNYITRDLAFWADSMQIYGLQKRASEMAASCVGLKAPDVICTDPSGQKRSIYDMKEPYIVVYMFNPNCDHCIAETPQLLNLFNQWKREGKGFGVYAIALDTDPEEWQGFIKKFNTSAFVNVFDPTNASIYAKYYVDNTPEIYVLNPDRIIIGKNLHPEQIPIIIDRDKKRQGSGS